MTTTKTDAAREGIPVIRDDYAKLLKACGALAMAADAQAEKIDDKRRAFEAGRSCEAPTDAELAACTRWRALAGNGWLALEASGYRAEAIEQ